MKKKLLLINDFSQSPTGYALYGRNLLSGLQARGYNVAELACYITPDDKRIKHCSWPVFANKPLDPERKAAYDANPHAEHGDFSFHQVLLDYKPTHVLDIRDPWAFEFEIRSPLRDYFSQILMPTVDAFPNSPDWIDYYSQANALLTYSEFGRDSIFNQGENFNFMGIASPATSEFFHQKLFPEKQMLKDKLSIPGNYLIGTVMRNQPRKLYADLFEGFRAFLSLSERKDVFLYCHTGFPDLGWNIPELLIEYELTNRVFFTYRCKNCTAVTSRFFSDSVCHCQSCGKFENCIAGPNNGLTDPELSCIYNCMDGYIQLSKNEGFGVPLIEAASCGVPIAAMPYSATESILNNLGGYRISIESFEKEASTGRMLAKPNQVSLIEAFHYFCDTSKETLYILGSQFSEKCKTVYSWIQVVDSWIRAIEKAKRAKRKWDEPIIQYQPGPMLDIKGPAYQATYLLTHVLGRPQMVGGQLWRRLVKDLTYNTRVSSFGDFYFNEMSEKDSLKHISFSYKDAYEEMLKLVEYYNVWEQHRITSLS